MRADHALRWFGFKAFADFCYCGIHGWCVDWCFGWCAGRAGGAVGGFVGDLVGFAGGALVDILVVVAGGAVGIGAVGIGADCAMVVRSVEALGLLWMSLLSLGVHVVAGWGWELTDRSIHCMTVELNERQVSV